MTCSRFSTHHRPVHHGWVLVVTLLALGACDLQLEDTNGSANNNSNDGSGGSGLTATVVANTKMTASIIDNFSGTNANGAYSSLPQGTDLSSRSLTAANGLGDTATGAFSLHTADGVVAFTIQDTAVCRGVAMIAGVGKNQTPNNHQVLMTLLTTEPVTGMLTVTLDGQASSLAGSGFTTIDVGNDGDPDFQTTNLQATYQEALTFDSAFEIRTETVTQVENINNISRSITLTFVPSGSSNSGNGVGGAAPAGFGDPLGGPLAHGSEAGFRVEEVEPICAPIPLPRGSFGVAELENLAVSGDQGAGVPLEFWPDECLVVDDPSLDCDGDLVLDGCQLLGDPSLDCDGDNVFDACQINSDPSLDQNQNGILDSCEYSFESYCQAGWNTSGGPAVIGALGTASLTANDLTLTVSGVPLGQFGFFFYGAGQGLVSVGDGAICVKSPLQPVYPLILPDGSGFGSLALDLGSPPFSSGAGQVAAFETWHFQFWFRDPLGGPAGFNFSDGLAVTFCP